MSGPRLNHRVRAVEVLRLLPHVGPAQDQRDHTYDIADEEEALMFADHETHRLAAGVFTRDLSRAIRVTKRIQAGTVWVNRYNRPVGPRNGMRETR
ncbi:hypothetical protein MES5069_360114 [Mesorhizobium escarrei]|uniref:Aldehyde dehydrogenase domain-containing protein n=1 Tax=Mesorhizobium escarrei TaxID=666018 RepID=A0ABM9E1R0_9HYPH|nr:hypothetical protein MES5069_360114 [Mesorhizobium escarrei]